jgi:hypothetical protein
LTFSAFHDMKEALSVLRQRPEPREKALMSKVTIYAPDGTAVKESTLNARDMVLHCGYSYVPGKAVTPTDSAAYARTAPPPGANPNKAQEILDQHGYDPNRTTPFAATEDEEVLEVGDEVEVADDPAPDGAGPAAPRRGRPPKAK